jgi:NADH:ubiquinone oxidoreductase subunit C
LAGPGVTFFQKVRELQARGANLAAIEALAEGERLQLTYYFMLDGKSERLPFAVEDGTCPSLIQLYGSADYMERALFQRHHTKFVGNPNLEAHS